MLRGLQREPRETLWDETLDGECPIAWFNCADSQEEKFNDIVYNL